MCGEEEAGGGDGVGGCKECGERWCEEGGMGGGGEGPGGGGGHGWGGSGVFVLRDQKLKPFLSQSFCKYFGCANTQKRMLFNLAPPIDM